MGTSADTELYYIKRDLRNVVAELDDIATGIQRDFEGIGEDMCAACISKTRSNCQSAQTKLNRIDTSKLSTKP